LSRLEVNKGPAQSQRAPLALAHKVHGSAGSAKGAHRACQAACKQL